jgi:hypothetical protein
LTLSFISSTVIVETDSETELVACSQDEDEVGGEVAFADVEAADQVRRTLFRLEVEAAAWAMDAQTKANGGGESKRKKARKKKTGGKDKK